MNSAKAVISCVRLVRIEFWYDFVRAVGLYGVSVLYDVIARN